ncbi:alpha/beta hydrolase family protein [Actinocorallia herbida]|uniref:Alpha/beta hydrolase family protein n=1 Tax=Actinocorallia herbida TaxID=58109 RepID=A0A3N1CRZ5_9ACTN|nr:alpha/beta hydrolase [Actinocorallia herbida]ROO83458.1 alpha/beta hydrolase family protein [Actinocorallia herbida]
MRTPGVAGVTVLLLAGAVVPGGSAAQAAPAPAIGWKPCKAALPAFAAMFESLEGVRIECAKLAVPLDRRRPDGKKFELALSRIPAAGGKPKGTLLVNPGGPGGTGTDFAVAVAGRASAKVRAAYDIVGFDPRGVGGSRPMSCLPDHFAPVRRDYNPRTPADFAYWKGRARAYAEACDKKYGGLLDHLKTTDTVADLESIRRALGERRLNFFGVSYGTYLGGVYATLHPRRVGRMVLDSNVSPVGVWYESNLRQNRTFDRNLDLFFAWTARHQDVYQVGGTRAEVRAFYRRTRAALARRPISASIGPKLAAADAPDGPTRMGPDELDDTFLAAGYRAGDGVWPLLAQALRARKEGDDKGLVVAYQHLGAQKEPGGYAVYTGTQCTDAPWPSRWSRWRRDHAAMARRFPFMTWSNAWYNLPCKYWKAAPGTPVEIRRRAGLPPVLLFQATYDAATPFSGGPEMRRRLGGHLVVEEGGLTHGIVQRGNAAVDRIFERYLLTGALPEGRTSRVRALPDPVPPVGPDAAARAVAETAGARLPGR